MRATPLDDLRGEVAAGRAVAIVGAGVSIAATGNAPAASWTGLLEDGVAHCDRLLGPSLPAGWAGAAGPSSPPGTPRSSSRPPRTSPAASAAPTAESTCAG